jgi:hypothetical protein
MLEDGGAVRERERGAEFKVQESGPYCPALLDIRISARPPAPGATGERHHDAERAPDEKLGPEGLPPANWRFANCLANCRGWDTTTTGW